MKGFFLKILNSYNYNINKINFSWIDPNDKSIKALPRRKSSSRNRILKNLENEISIKNKMNSLEQINKYKNNSVKNIAIIKNKSISNYFRNLSNNLNDNTTNISIENHSNINYNLTQTENTNLNNIPMIIKLINQKAPLEILFIQILKSRKKSLKLIILMLMIAYLE